MRHLLHFTLFALALTVVTRVEAQDRRRGGHQTTVVIAAERGPRTVQPVRTRFEPSRAIYDSRRTIHQPSHAMRKARRDYLDAREDFAQIVRIADRWEQATANRNRHAQSKIDQRLDAWLDREIRESIRTPHNQRYTLRLRGLSHELAKLDRRGSHGRGHADPGYNGRGQGNYYVRKGRILDDLVRLSERQVTRAQANIRTPLRLSLAYR